MTAPDYLPVLDYGQHSDPKDGACLMEAVSFIAGERWSDHPVCVHPVIASCARMVNDAVNDEERHKLVTLIPRLIGTNDTRDEYSIGRALLTKTLGDWCAKHYIKALSVHWPERSNTNEVARQRINHEWTRSNGVHEQQKLREWSCLMDWSTSMAASYVEFLDDGESDTVAILVGLLDYYDKLTKRGVPSEMPTDRLKALHAASVE